jgi:hypothetical protein
MATQQIKWLANTGPNVIAYEILKSDTGFEGPYTTLTQVLHIIPGTNWNATGNYFFYNDAVVPHRYYRLVTLDRYGNRGEGDAPIPFRAGNNPVETPDLHTMPIDENTGGANSLQYISQGGTPIKDARIRIYKKVDWDTQNYSAAIGTTITLATGGWQSPIFVQPGDTYTIVYTKTNEFGPDTKEIVV